MLESIVAFFTAEAAGIFALLFLNNVLMYLMIRRKHQSEIQTLVGSQRTALKHARSKEDVLRSLLYSFADEKAGEDDY